MLHRAENVLKGFVQLLNFADNFLQISLLESSAVKSTRTYLQFSLPEPVFSSVCLNLFAGQSA
jgi:hypothetical protein